MDEPQLLARRGSGAQKLQFRVSVCKLVCKRSDRLGVSGCYSASYDFTASDYQSDALVLAQMSKLWAISEISARATV